MFTSIFVTSPQIHRDTVSTKGAVFFNQNKSHNYRGIGVVHFACDGCSRYYIPGKFPMSKVENPSVPHNVFGVKRVQGPVIH